jgi:hypothetical protein
VFCVEKEIGLPLNLSFVNVIASIGQDQTVKMAQEFLTSQPAGPTLSTARKALVDKSDSTLPFPFKLHALLEEAEDCGTDHMISWLPSGEAFKIHSPVLFEESVMDKYFRQTKLKSFTRQLVSFYTHTARLEGMRILFAK